MELPAQRFGALPHGEQAERGAPLDRGRVESAAVVGHAEPKPVAVPDFDAHVVRMSVATGVRDRFVDDPEEGLACRRVDLRSGLNDDPGARARTPGED